jgi:hypothetical protein
VILKNDVGPMTARVGANVLWPFDSEGQEVEQGVPMADALPCHAVRREPALTARSGRRNRVRDPHHK